MSKATAICLIRNRHLVGIRRVGWVCVCNIHWHLSCSRPLAPSPPSRHPHLSRCIDCDFGRTKSQLHRVIVTNPFRIHQNAGPKAHMLRPAYVGQPNDGHSERAIMGRNRQGVSGFASSVGVRSTWKLFRSYVRHSRRNEAAEVYVHNKPARTGRATAKRTTIHIIIGKSMHAFATTTHM